MLPTKLARAALAGKRCSVVPPDAVVALMTISRCAGGSELVVPEGGSAVRRSCAARPGSRTGPSSPAAYVPTGYVPDGEVIGVTVSSRRAGVAESRRCGALRSVAHPERRPAAQLSAAVSQA